MPKIKSKPWWIGYRIDSADMIALLQVPPYKEVGEWQHDIKDQDSE